MKVKEDFEKAYKKVSTTNQVLPLDILLSLYAYCKQTCIGNYYLIASKTDIREAFRLNVWSQLQGMTESDAMKNYIVLVNTYLNEE